MTMRANKTASFDATANEATPAGSGVSRWFASLPAIDAAQLRGAIAGAVSAVFADTSRGDPMAPYLAYPGDPGLCGPDSVCWRVHGDLPGMMIGGIAALMFQALHPLAMAGVDEHSDFRVDPLGRLRRTAAFVAAVTYGAAPLAEQHIAAVRKIHERILGVAPDGRPYSANDPELLTWVHTAEHSCFLWAYQRYAPRKLSDAEADRYLDEVAPVALRLGARWVPRDCEQLDSYLQRVRPQLYFGPQARRAFEFIEQGAFRDPGTRVVYQLMVRAAKSTLPAWVRRRAGIELMPLEDALITGPAIDLLGRVLRWGVGEPLPMIAARQRCAATAPVQRQARRARPARARLKVQAARK